MSDRIAQRDGTRKRLKKARRKQLLIRLGTAVGVVALLIALALIFQVRTIHITGNSFLTKEEILQYIEKQGGADNSLVLLARTKFGSFPVPDTAESIQFTMKNPWTIQVKVTEKTPIGYVESDGKYVYFDEEGYVLGILEELREDVTKIEGLDVKKASKGKKLSVKDDAVFGYLVQVIDLLERKELASDRILCDGENITLYFGEVCVELGSGNPEEKIAQLPTILPMLEGQKGTLHLEHFGDSTDTISFEKK